MLLLLSLRKNWTAGTIPLKSFLTIHKKKKVDREKDRSCVKVEVDVLVSRP